MEKNIKKETAAESDNDRVCTCECSMENISEDTGEKTDKACSSGCEHCRHKERSEKEYKDLITRLNRIEGQIRGIKGMVDNSAYCLDILTQVSAATSALNSFSKVLLSSHIKSCVANDIRDGHEDKLDELVQFLPKMMK